MKNNFNNIIKTIGSPKIFVFTVMWMIFLVVVGTLVQRELGLYYAQQKYFSSWFTLLGFLPIPSGRLVMSIIIVNLSCYFFRPDILKLNKVGITIVHSGVIMLLVGGGLTAIFSTEGSMVINEGERSNFIEDYHLKEFAVINTSHEEFDEFIIFDQPLLFDNNILIDESFPFKIEILGYYDNSEALPRIYRGDETLKGMAKNFYLEEKMSEKEYEKNIAGVIYKIYDSNIETNGTYISYLGQPITQTISIGEKEYSIIIRRQRNYLPFEIQLNDFKKVLHPGTEIAKSYSSDINLIENNISRKVLIQMNEPLRHRGYTFYQASFFEDGSKQTTILAAVKNYGRLFPYIATTIMCIGLLFHMLIKIPNRLSNVSEK